MSRYRRRYVLRETLADGTVVTASGCGDRPPTDTDRAIVRAAGEELRRLAEADPALGDKQQAALARIRALRSR